MLLLYVLIFIFGLSIGSFLNVVILRTHGNNQFWHGRSFCPQCGYELKWYDNVPVLSFILLMGKCRQCKKKISWQYPVVELVTGILFAFTLWAVQPFLMTTNIYYFIILLLYYLIVVSFLIIIFVYDLKYYLILNRFIWPAGILVLLGQIFLFVSASGFSWQTLLVYLGELFFSAIITGGFFWLQYTISRGKWIGGGDVRLGFLMGLILGWPACLVALFLAYVIGLIVSLPLVIFFKKSLKSHIPFGTFLTLATLVTMWWGADIVNWYFNVLPRLLF